ncbi:MAG TPA: phosphoribulokinase [Gemmatimonadales bacterium]|nr:phosphoribulokinase [Gemmatimonadales bacterium]
MQFWAGRPLMLCLVGDSGAGKSTLSNGCVTLLGQDRVTDICLDDYHSLDRVGRAAKKITALHPDCNYLDLIAQHMRLLRTGQRVFKPVYDHSDGTFGPPEFAVPRDIVLVHGLHALYTPALRQIWDVSVFLDPDPELRIDWKIKRDVSKRGYTREEVVQQLEERRHDSEAYVMPQREKADMVISFCPSPEYRKTKDSSRLNVQITLRHPIPLPDVEDAFRVAGDTNGEPPLKLHRGAEGTDRLEISGRISDAVTQEVERRMWNHMPTARHLKSDRLGLFMDGAVERRSNPLAVTQLVLTYYLVKMTALILKQEQLRQEAAASGGSTLH